MMASKFCIINQIGITLSGSEFNRIYKDTIFLKLTNETENHNGFQFMDGLNIDSVSFDPTGECKPGGIYFTKECEAWRWLNYNSKVMIYMRIVTIPNDANVYIEDMKFKADKIILESKQRISQKIYDDAMAKRRIVFYL